MSVRIDDFVMLATGERYSLGAVTLVINNNLDTEGLTMQFNEELSKSIHELAPVAKTSKFFVHRCSKINLFELGKWEQTLINTFKFF